MYSGCLLGTVTMWSHYQTFILRLKYIKTSCPGMKAPCLYMYRVLVLVLWKHTVTFTGSHFIIEILNVLMDSRNK